MTTYTLMQTATSIIRAFSQGTACIHEGCEFVHFGIEATGTNLQTLAYPAFEWSREGGRKVAEEHFRTSIS